MTSVKKGRRAVRRTASVATGVSGTQQATTPSGGSKITSASTPTISIDSSDIQTSPGGVAGSSSRTLMSRRVERQRTATGLMTQTVMEESGPSSPSMVNGTFVTPQQYSQQGQLHTQLSQTSQQLEPGTVVLPLGMTKFRYVVSSSALSVAIFVMGIQVGLIYISDHMSWSTDPTWWIIESHYTLWGMAGINLMMLLYTLRSAWILIRDTYSNAVTAGFLGRTYVAICIYYGCIYWHLSRWDDEGYKGLDTHYGVPQLHALQCIYFSFTTMSTVGYGDIAPLSWINLFVVNTHQVVSVGYSTVIFGLGLSHFSSVKNDSPPLMPHPSRSQIAPLGRGLMHSMGKSKSALGKTFAQTQLPDQTQDGRGNSFQFSLPEDPPAQSKVSSRLTVILVDNSLMLTLFIQALILGSLSFLGSFGVDVHSQTGIMTMVVMQGLAIVLTFLASYRLAAVVKDKSVTANGLLSTWMSITITFAGLFLVLFYVDTESFTGVFREDEIGLSPLTIFLRLMYFSVTTMTTVGYGDISPGAVWYVWTVVNFEQTLSILFTAVVFSLGLAKFSKQQAALG